MSENPFSLEELKKAKEVLGIKTEIVKEGGKLVGKLTLGPVEISIRKARKHAKFDKGFSSKYKINYQD